MYVVTFYSFKGGVGRTMAVVNVGVELAKIGRRVLLVDFDLEAPGLETFNLARPLRAQTPGLVEYISNYVATGKAPDVSDYLYESVGEWKGEGRLWIMPAGIQDDSYGYRLSSIDWQGLYRDQEGYLFFEDLKKQWEEQLSPDYVLIDSRTGYTDESGICTRQLPDAVVILFFPNDQNLFGLKKMVSDVRDEAKGSRGKNILLHFVSSNVPDADDEEQILEGRIERFQEHLGFERPAATIRHYTSLALLNQVVFTSDRPKTRLAQEYRSLVRSIILENPADAEGARELLGKVSKNVNRFMRTSRLSSADLDRKLEDIRQSHSTDGEILYQLAVIRERQGFPSETIIQLLNDAARNGYQTAEVFARLADLYYAANQVENALVSIKHLLQTTDITHFDVNLAIRLLRKIGGSSKDLIDQSQVLRRLDIDGRIAVAEELHRRPDDLPLATEIVEKVLKERTITDEQKDRAKTALVLILIGTGRFHDAMKLIGYPRPIPENLNEYDAFNYAMAEWGASGRLPTDMMQRVLAIHNKAPQQTRRANYLQCMAIVFWSMGDLEKARDFLNLARRQIAAASVPKNEFSAWRYLYVNEARFLKDLKSFEEMMEGQDIVPDFMARNALGHD